MKIIPILFFSISILLLTIGVIDIPLLKKSISLPEENATNITIKQDITNLTEENKIIALPIIEYECLNDSHCNDSEICVYNKCKNLTCEFPYYAQDHKCERLECIINEECRSNQYCSKLYNVCMKLYCGFCQYPEDHHCKRYFCCADYECGTNATCFYHKCLQNPSVIKFQTLLAGNRRTTYRTILDYSILRNFDIGLLLIQNQKELDKVNKNILYLNDMIFEDFQNYTILAVAQHGKMPADVNFNRIYQIDNVVYVKIDTSEGEQGFTDDAWHVVKVRRDDFTEKNNLIFKITPTGKMIVGGEEITYTSILYPADKDGGPYRCTNITLYEGESKTINLYNRDYTIQLLWVESAGGKEYATISLDGSPNVRMGEGNSTKINNLQIYAGEIFYTGKEIRLWATLGLCYEDL